MADKPVTVDVGAGAQYTAAIINSNFSVLEDAVEGCLGRGGTAESSNSMEGDLDANLNQIKNLPTPLVDNDAANKLYVDTVFSGTTILPTGNITTAKSSGDAVGWDAVNSNKVTTTFTNYNELKGVDAFSNNDGVIVLGRSTANDGGGGVFYWDSSDLSTEVTADTQQGIYVAPSSDATGASGAWVRQYEGALLPEWFGAVGDGVTDDTVACNAAVDAGDIVEFSNTYAVDPGTGAYEGIILNSNNTIIVNGIIKSLPTSTENYSVINITGVSNVKICGDGHIVGDRNIHTGATGEWGFCVFINGATTVEVTGVKIHDAWGDGVFVGNNTISKNITISGCDIYSNRRNNISVVFADGIKIINNNIYNANGTNPQMGIDVEPDTLHAQYVYDILISDNVIYGNYRSGIRLEATHEPVYFATISNNALFDNCSADSLTAEIDLSYVQSVTVTGNTIFNSKASGIVADNTKKSTINGNVIYRVDFDGIRLTASHQIIVGNNSVYGASELTDVANDSITIDSASYDVTLSGNITSIPTTGNSPRYGLNNAASTVTANGNLFSGKTADINDTATQTVYAGNIEENVTLADGDTTPNVLGRKVIKTANTGATSITKFVGGKFGQILYVNIDTNTTVVHDGTFIRLTGGVNFTGGANSVLTLLCNTAGGAGYFVEVSRA